MLIGWECKPPAGGEMPAENMKLDMKPEGTDAEANWKVKKPRDGERSTNAPSEENETCLYTSLT
jgi:hypothetical protein